VRVLHVDEWPKGLSTSLAFAEGPGAASDLVAAHAELRHRAEALIADASRRLKSARFRTQTEMRDGDARHAILDCADEWRPDVVVLGSHGRKGLGPLPAGQCVGKRAASCALFRPGHPRTIVKLMAVGRSRSFRASAHRLGIPATSSSR
jgi:nucleotide-binding universal stress UspA family protein